MLYIIQLIQIDKITLTRSMHPLIIRGISKIEMEIHEELMEAYELFDNRNKGYIDAHGLGDAMKVLGYQVDKKQVQEMISTLSENNKAVISKDQFKKFMTARLDFRDDADELKQAFDYLDTTKRGKIGPGNLQKMAEEMGEKQEECGRIIMEADKDQDGFINEQEFMRAIKKTSYY